MSHFSSNLRVEFPRRERERFPLGTRFRLRVKACQKHRDGKVNGPPYLRACKGTVELIAASISYPGWFAVHNPRYSDCRAYTYKLLA